MTVNDVVTAICAGALRQFLADRDALPEVPLVASVPVSVHGKSSRPGRNQTTWMLCRLETHIDDPVHRLTTIAEKNAAAKEHAAAMGPTLLQDWTQVAGQTVFGVARKLLPRIRCRTNRRTIWCCPTWPGHDTSSTSWAVGWTACTRWGRSSPARRSTSP